MPLETKSGSRGAAPHHLIIGTWWRWKINTTRRPLYTRGKAPTDTHRMGSHMGSRDSQDVSGGDKISYLHRSSKHGPSSPHRVTKSTELSRPWYVNYYFENRHHISGCRDDTELFGEVTDCNLGRAVEFVFRDSTQSRHQDAKFHSKIRHSSSSYVNFNVRHRFVFSIWRRVFCSRGIFLGWRSRLPVH